MAEEDPSDFAIVQVPSINSAVATTPTAPALEGAPGFFWHRARNGGCKNVEKRPEGQEYIFELTDEDRKTWPELIGIARISFWQKKENEAPIMLTVAIRDGSGEPGIDDPGVNST